MPRDSNGNFTLYTPGNPVVTQTTISSAWANNTLQDIGNEITDSLDRSGKGGMLAPFKVTDGTVAAPSLAFQNENGTGFWRAGAGEMAVSILGTQVGEWTSAGLTADAFMVDGAIGSAGTSGIYQPGTNELGLFTNGVLAASISAAQVVSLANPLPIASGGTGATTAAAAVTALGIPDWSDSVVGGDLVQWTSDGYLYANYLNQSSVYNENPTLLSVAVMSSANDGFHRWCQVGNFYEQLMGELTTVEADPGSGYPSSGSQFQIWAYY